MKLNGNAWKFTQEDISTDLIRGKAWSHLPPKEQGAHCLEEVDAAFAQRFQLLRRRAVEEFELHFGMGLAEGVDGGRKVIQMKTAWEAERQAAASVTMLALVNRTQPRPEITAPPGAESSS